MNLIERITRGGSIVGYSILTIVLIAASASTIYFVRQRGEQVRETEVIAEAPIVEEESPIVGTVEETLEEVPPQEDNQRENQEEPEESEATEDQEDLPVTGPAETLATVIGIAALTAASVAYLQSRRDSAQL